MPANLKELVEKNNAVIRMNKAKAYRELQRRQGRIIRRVWNEAPLYDFSAIKQGNSSVYKPTPVDNNSNQSKSNMLAPDYGQMTDHGGKLMNSSLFSINNQRPKYRARQKELYPEPGRPITAPETDPYATLDGTRHEVMVIPNYPIRASSVRSQASDTQSLNEFSNRRLQSRKFRHANELTQSIDCNSNAPFKPRDQNKPVGEAIQYPAASKMREMLATDSCLPMEKPVTVVETGSRGIMKRGSQISFASRISIQSQQPLHSETQISKLPVASPATPATIKSVRRPTQNQPVTVIQRRISQPKQVSFLEKGDNSKDRMSPKTVPSVDSEELQPLALTAKNLNKYNAMILKTIRTSKFDERIVQWVKERQCDQKSRIAKHDDIPEVDEAGYGENHGRATPNKRDHSGSNKTPRESERTIHVKYQSREQPHSVEQPQSVEQLGQALYNDRGLENLKLMKPTSLQPSKPAVEFSYSLEKEATDIREKESPEEKLTEQMSAKTDSNDKNVTADS